ncbi:hypothetical protein W97_04100 [Coniosporium apollinis CBS 100218]|uniref:Uncharacterized protein n=1 Tax=Coniosporium apollinis (strain CBS 100218) TaxID=1168221 RepID=R7YT58_CONA1|nr:uncharacterized protein W97_04100 [Coniosporium apollinis CBS 100218]EON64866.1 hypothetical protein W97_04100 [Coniosporium apollinis CBS 100218]
MSAQPASLQWTAQYSVAPSSRSTKLPGDKILLPPSALEQLLAAAPTITTEPTYSRPYTSAFDPYNPFTFAAERAARAQFQDRQQQLPHPLTFRLVNPQNGRVIYAGIREFSAEEGEVVLSSVLRQALGIEDPQGSKTPSRSPTPGNSDDDEAVTNGVQGLAVARKNAPRITIHVKELPKGTYVKLRPLEAGYNPEDWKSLLEQHMRANFTTLTNGEVLVVPGGRGVGGKLEEFRFLVDGFKPEGDAICVVDTDLEVDIEALNEEQARETLKRIAEKAQRAPGTDQGSSAGGRLDLFRAQSGHVLDGEYVDYEIPSWDRSQGLEIELGDVEEEDEVDLFVSPFSTRQRVRPREDEYVFGEFEGRYPKRIRLAPTNIELEGAEAVWVSVHAYAPPETSQNGDMRKAPKHYTIRASPFDLRVPPPASSNILPASNNIEHNPDEVQCKNCLQWVPQRTLFLHENFCLRNNIRCPNGCNQVFLRTSPAWANHWHCPHDSSYGNTPLSKAKHNHLYHTSYTCPSCTSSTIYPTLPALAHHRTTTCPGKPILCQFCHLQVPQEGDPDTPSPEALLTGLTPHELADGARTTECHRCGAIVRLRDMAMHLRHHELEKLSRPQPRVCRNALCGRTLDGVSKTGDTRAGTRRGQGPGNDIGLCSQCFGPLYVAVYDPEGRALRRRVERRYLSQLLTGCGKAWCRNPYCKTGREHLGIGGSVSTKEALPMVKPFLDGLGRSEADPARPPLHFCVDEGSQKKRGLAELLAAEDEGDGGFGFEWCVAALEAEGGDLEKAREWLRAWAPSRSEVR